MYDVSLNFSDLVGETSTRPPFRVIGIDLGTTNSVVACIDIYPGSKEFEIEVVEIEQQTRSGTHFGELVPSAIAITEKTTYIGQGALHCRSFMRELRLEQDRNIFWDTKNFIGVKRTLHKAPEGYQTAQEIATHILQFLFEQAKTHRDSDVAVENSVVSVPASFNFKQKGETKEAAERAGLELSRESLVDEPSAAFIAYMYTYGHDRSLDLSIPKNLVVFDFGGGTCDVAVFRLQRVEGHISKSPLSVSRYHRLGGGDIDRSIVVEVLLPQLYEQNNISPHDLDYFEKSKELIPHLLGVAESLKIGLCTQLMEAKKFDKYGEVKSELAHTHTKAIRVTLNSGQVLQLKSPELVNDQFESILSKYLDQDLLHHQETEYLLSCSIFAPIEDALARAHLRPDNIDYCLTVGGSCLIPQVQEAIAKYFKKAEILTFREYGEIQTCVAKGAALQALHIAIRDRGLVPPTSSDSISIRTAGGGNVELIPTQAKLPFPDETNWAFIQSLKLPASATTDSYPLKLELVNSGEDIVSRDSWEIQPIASKGDPLLLQYRMDENQYLELKLSLKDDSEHEIYHETQNPFSNIVNPNSKRERILELEEKIKTEPLPEAAQQRIVEEIANLEDELGNYEKALSLLKNLNRVKPSSKLLHKMGLICGSLQDYDRQEKFYRECARLQPRSGACLFNLALLLQDQARISEAIECVEEAVKRDSNPVYHVFKVFLLREIENDDQLYQSELSHVITKFPNLSAQTHFQLSWYRKAALQTHNTTLVKKIDAERQRRKKMPQDDHGGYLPAGPTEIIPT